MCLCCMMDINTVVFWLVFMPYTSHTAALPGSYWLLTMSDICSHLVSPMKDLWWTKWHRNRLLSDSRHFSFPRPIIFSHRCSIPIAHRGVVQQAHSEVSLSTQSQLTATTKPNENMWMQLCPVVRHCWSFRMCGLIEKCHIRQFLVRFKC